MMAVIEERQEALDSLYGQYAGGAVAAHSVPPPVVSRGDLTPADIELMAKIAQSRQGDKFNKLYAGDFSGYASQSEADLALCQMLAWWCCKDFEQIDRIFRHSRLDREKWDEQRGELTYGEMTIDKAIARTDKVYGEVEASEKKVKSIKRVFRLIQAGKLQCKPPLWLIRGLIELDSLGLLFGDPGIGKSLLAIALALSVATGMPFYGKAVVKQGPVVLIVGEGFNGLIRRMMAWSIHHKIDHKDAPLFISEMPAALTDGEMLALVQDSIALVTEEHGPPVLIIIDTLARNFGPGDENSTQDMSQFIQSVDALRAESKAAILIVHHSGHGDKSRARGAMALKGALDAEFRLDRDTDGVIRMEVTKMKDSKYPEPTAYRIEPVSLPLRDEDGSPVFSAVLISTSYAPPPQKGKKGQGKHQIKAIDILKSLESKAIEECKQKGLDPATARVSLDEWKMAMRNSGIPQQRVTDVIASLDHIITGGEGFVSLL